MTFSYSLPLSVPFKATTHLSCPSTAKREGKFMTAGLGWEFSVPHTQVSELLRENPGLKGFAD
jgi:hypothetical protein